MEGCAYVLDGNACLPHDAIRLIADDVVPDPQDARRLRVSFGGPEESDRALKMLQQLAFPGQQVGRGISRRSSTASQSAPCYSFPEMAYSSTVVSKIAGENIAKLFFSLQAFERWGTGDVSCLTEA